MIYTSFFDDDFCDNVRSGLISFPVGWQMYRKYHNMYDLMKDRKTITNIMTEFRQIFENLSAPVPLSHYNLQCYLNSFNHL